MYYVVRFIHDGVDKTEEVYRQYGLEVHLPPLPEKPTYEDSPSFSASISASEDEDDGEEGELAIDEETMKVKNSLWNAMYNTLSSTFIS